MNGRTTRNTSPGRLARLAGRAPAFTLIEVLVAVGAVALVAVGLAAIFEATGRTVRTGRRVSAFNAYASLIQQRLASDIASMSRDGVLVIHNQHADLDGTASSIDAIPLHAGDVSGRVRRIDEIVFFAEGDFTTSREPLHPALVAESGAARIYYGHGKPRRTAWPEYLEPKLDDSNIDGSANLGYKPAGSTKNPSRFAADWILARHVTLLSPPRTNPRALPQPTPFGLKNALYDNDIQAAGQPAASSVFRVLSTIFPTGAVGAIRGNVRPQFSSGIVDIATTDLPEIRTVINTANVFPAGADDTFFDQPNGPLDGEFSSLSNDPDIVRRMQFWMAEVLPGWSHAQDPDDRVRVRCEPEPPDYIGVVGAAGTPLTLAYRRADQLAVSSSNFIPNCTEFIVEWSFGVSYPDNDPDQPGELIWHGMDREVGGVPVAEPYDPAAGIPESAHAVRWRRLDGAMGAPHAVDPLLIHDTTTDPDQLMSFFGYIDPSFEPDKEGPSGPGADGKLESPGDAAQATIPWAWPKLIRVTMSLADPNDPSYEQTFQFVFEAPGDPEP